MTSSIDSENATSGRLCGKPSSFCLNSDRNSKAAFKNCKCRPSKQEICESASASYANLNTPDDTSHVWHIQRDHVSVLHANRSSRRSKRSNTDMRSASVCDCKELEQLLKSTFELGLTSRMMSPTIL